MCDKYDGGNTYCGGGRRYVAGDEVRSSGQDGVDVLMKSGASSMQLKSRGLSMVELNFLPAKMPCNLFLKDLEIIQDALEAADLNASLFKAALPLYKETAQTYPEEDTASVYRVIGKTYSNPTL